MIGKSETPKKKKILIADDEALILETLEEFLKPFEHSHNFEVFTVQNGEEAIGILDSIPINLVITDLNMPKVDGFKVISHIISNYPHIPVVVMTAFGSPETEKKLMEMEVVYYVEKPIEFNRFIATILELIAQEKKGKIEGISISIFMQLLEMEKTTCTLIISSGNKKGNLFLRNGELIEAETESLKSMKAALDILRWEGVRIDLKKGCDIQTPTIHMPLTQILLESSRLKDEEKQNKLSENEAVPEEKNHPQEKAVFFHENDFGLELEKIETLVETKEEQKIPPDIPIKVLNIKEVKMDIPKLTKAIEVLKNNLSGALISTDIFSSEDAQPIAGWNSNPAACAVFGQFTNSIVSSLKDAGLPRIGRYYLMDLVDKKIVVVIPMGDYQWSMLIDSSKTQLGLILNLAIPKAINAFEEALVG